MESTTNVQQLPVIRVIAPGSRVKLGDIEARVVGVSIRDGGRSTYEIAWVSGSARNSAWVEEFELEPAPKEQRLPVGFTPAPTRGEQLEAALASVRECLLSTRRVDAAFQLTDENMQAMRKIIRKAFREDAQ